jgi:hypothetical protein
VLVAAMAVVGGFVACSGAASTDFSGTDDGAAPEGASRKDGGLRASSGGSTGGGSSSRSGGGSTSGGGSSSGPSSGGSASSGGSGGTASSGSSGGTASSGSSGAGSSGGSGSSGAGSSGAGSTSGWLSTSGSKIYVSNGSGGKTPWMGRGVNVDDIFLCGYNYTLSMSSPDKTLETILAGAIGWKANFLRISLAMASDGVTVSWLSNPSQYKTPMTNVIEAIKSSPGVYVLVTLRSDSTMVGQDQGDGDPEATGIPSAATDAVYTALVDTFANDSFVLFGLTNEPGGGTASNSTLASAMSHAVGTIRAEEDKLGVPHHIVSVQGNSWTSDISFYSKTPLAYDNVVYEVHGYPPAASSYTYSNIPVILGEYGSLSDSASFYADVEAKQIPNLAWDFEPYSDCTPDLVNVTTSASNPSPTSWGSTVKSYLMSH